MSVRNVIGVLAILCAGLDIAIPSPPDSERSGRDCLALAGFAEARGEGDIGMAAVMNVVINRATDAQHRWPETLCAVVQQPGQFIGIENWSYPRHPELSDLSSWHRALDIADQVIAKKGPELGTCSVATSFDRGGSKAGLQQVCRLSNHTFYTESPRLVEN